MRQVIVAFSILALMAALTGRADGQTKKVDPKSKDPYLAKLPIPDYDIPLDVTIWKPHFLLVKTTYDADESKVVFLLKSKRLFTFTDDGFVAPLRFLDEDGVNLIKDKNLKFDPQITKLKVGELTRCYLTLPDEEILKKTKKAQAVLQGFFTKDKK